MKIKRILYLITALLLVSALAPGFQPVTAGSQQQAGTDQPLPVDSQPQAQAAPGSLYVVLNEVMPKPTAGAPAWVELYVGQALNYLYLPTIRSNKASPAPLEAESSWLASLPTTVNLNSWQVSNQAGQSYTLPANLPLLPKNTFVLIYFDGSGPAGNDLDLNDGKIVLHTPGGLNDIFPDAAGQAALYRPGAPSAATIADYLAWGAYSEAGAAAAVAAGVWGAGEAASFENGFGDITESDILAPNESLGRYPGANGSGAANWANYPQASLTPGAANPVQPVLFITPENGARVETSGLALSWRQAAGASLYRFQLDNTNDFSSPLVDLLTSSTFYKPNPALAAGVYFWRINPIRNGTPAGWSAAFSVEAANLSAGQQPLAAERVLGIARVRQNKDSRLLGLDGAPEGDPTTDLPEDAWDAPAPCTRPPCTDTTKYMHGNMYCVRASVRMVASYYNTNPASVLSMDRLSYYILQEWAGNTHAGTHDSTPDNDLGYNRGMYYPDEEDQLFSWALNFTYTTPGGKPSFATVKTAINANQPIMFRRPGHMMVIDGYRETDGGGQYLHILDPDQPPDFERWQDYSTQTIDGYWVGPTGGPANGQSRIDETSITTDSDGDGIMNFDEILRFALDPFDADSDGDWVADKKDMREYVFNTTGAYSFRGSDSDGDGLRKEKDNDNDADGSPDGCEDTNRNGKFDPASSETDNFNNGSSQACQPYFDILYPLKLDPVNAGDYTSPSKILVQVSTAVPSGWSLSLAAGDFNVQIGGHAADVIAVYPSADTYFLVVQPPTQSSANYYDLRVSLGVQNDSESDAVFYLPKNPGDEVIVLDRSGSMLANDKIGAAKNAASAFVDFLNDGDWVGVASFASSASSNYTLHEITAGSSIRTDAINAIQGLTAGGTTALGQGVQTGYGMLTTAAHGDHDWSMVLLSDGWENVAPYWATVAPGIANTTIHTVALGSDADTVLLQKIAAVEHGSYFYVNVDPPAVLAPSSPVPMVPLAMANTLPNRLADAYLSIGEINARQQRLYEFIAPAGGQKLLVDIPKGLPEVTFSLNWSTPYGVMKITEVYDPDGKLVKDAAVYADDTHEHWRINSPLGGEWVVVISVLKQYDGMEMFFTASGRSDTTLIAAVGGDPQAITPGTPVPIYGVLTDIKPISGASVAALIHGPSGSAFLTLYDDGAHKDGKADDGLYGNLYEGAASPGGYNVKLVASGANNSGETFLRYASTSFNVLPRLAYIWKDKLDVALEFETLLEKNLFAVDLLPLSKVTYNSLQPYQLLIVGAETGYMENWGTEPALGAILKSQKPVLGLGEGGYAFFGKMFLAIGYGNGAHSSGTSINWINDADPIWNEPYKLTPFEGAALQLYGKPSTRVDIYLPKVPLNVTVFGRYAAGTLYYDLLMENNQDLLWGFDGSPSKMTEIGRRLFVNTVFRLLP